MTDRDTFAAAALTGLLYPDVDDEFAMSYIVGRAYLWADAMLRERCRGGGDCPDSDNAPNLDAAPEARAESDEDRTDKAATSHRRDGTGDTPATHATHGEGSVRREGTEPVAWGVAAGGRVLATSIHRIDAVDMQSEHECDTEVVPLYRHPQPTLTDAEREALHWFSHYGLPEPKAAALRGLLERLS